MFLMHYLSYISFSFLLFQMFNVWVNFLFSQKIKREKDIRNQLVSLLIPARNEEKNIDSLLKHLLGLETNNIEIIVYDDQSTDETAKIVHRYARSDERIRFIQSEKLPKGWLGKNHACYQLAQQAKGDFYLFIDADVKLYDSIVQDSLVYVRKKKLGLLSVFPVQVLKTWGEKISVPIMNYILLTLLPLVFVRKSPFVTHSAANGQFMLFDANIYKRFQPHKEFKHSPVEDIHISRYLKKKQIKTACITGDRRVKCRMYENYKQALDGFTKNVFMFFGNHPFVAFLFWIMATFGIVPIVIFDFPYIGWYLFILILNQCLIALISKQSSWTSVLLFPAQLIFLFHVMSKALFIKNNSGNLWKGRKIY